MESLACFPASFHQALLNSPEPTDLELQAKDLFRWLSSEKLQDSDFGVQYLELHGGNSE